MSEVTQAHVEHDTLTLDVNIPEHDKRETSALFRRTRELLIEREGGRCFLSNATAEESGHPLEAHHHPIERCMAELIDWVRFADDCKKGQWGPYAMAFDWDDFFRGAMVHTHDGVVEREADDPLHVSNSVQFVRPRDPYLFVDDMTVNGMLLSKKFHTGKGSGIHDMPFPLYIAQRYAREGYQFSSVTTIHHFDGEGHQ
ncbi:hypothetical protein [Burkholderia gladioli]|uniref:hypothetical protein n=1 Tax=Burkholderia gladioli TaxID=28095 RepID=UPI0016409423|nr:hypothetical protein [Burkholderia gladioli]